MHVPLHKYEGLGQDFPHSFEGRCHFAFMLIMLNSSKVRLVY